MSTTGIWEELELEPGSAGLALRRLHADSDRDLFLCVDLGSRMRSLRFVRSWRPADKVPPLPTAKGVRCRSELKPGGRQMHVVVELVDVALTDVFTPLVEDLARRVSAAPDDSAGTTALAQGMTEWQELFKQLDGTGLGALVRRGLVGELLVMLDHVLPARGSDDSASGWTGPLKANQDFQFAGLAVEVKTSTGKQPQGLRVANERELDDTGVGVLLLVHLALDERRGGAGRVLPQLVAEVESALAERPAALRLFRERLALLGYRSVDLEHYAEPHYELRATRIYRVSDGFPRIVEGDLRAGVGDVSYSVAVSAYASFELTAEEARTYLEASS